MSKPDDIPQDVWGAAQKLVPLWAFAANRVTAVQHIIAIAIMAAKAGAYTDAADLAQRMAAGRKAQSEQAKAAKQPKIARDFESMAMSAFDVSAAIRKRGEG